METVGKQYVISPVRSPLSLAVGRILQGYGWSEASSAADATLVIFHHERHEIRFALNRLEFYHHSLGGPQKGVVFLSAHDDDGNEDASAPNWAFRLVPPCVDRNRLKRFAEEWQPCHETRTVCATAKAADCRRLILHYLGVADIEQFKGLASHVLEDKWLEYSSAFALSENLADFYYFLLLICGNYDPKHHDAEKQLERTSSVLSGWLESAADGELEGKEIGDLLEVVQRQSSKQILRACEDVRRSLAHPMLREDRKPTLLVIDDNPGEYQNLLHETALAFFQDDFEILVWNPLYDEDEEYALLRLMAYSSGRGFAQDAPVHIKVHELGPDTLLGSREMPRRVELVDVVRKAGFILVDQLFKHGVSATFVGPKLIMGITRLVGDGAWQEGRQPAILAFSRTDDPEIIHAALNCGARDFVLKSNLLGLPAVLAKVQRATASGEERLHRNFRALYQLPNETVGLLRAIHIPRIALHRNKQGTAGGGESGKDGTRDSTLATTFAGLIRALPKTDLHVHAGSCMSPEFLVVASVVGLLRPDPSPKSPAKAGQPSGEVAEKLNRMKATARFFLSGPLKAAGHEWRLKPSELLILRSPRDSDSEAARGLNTCLSGASWIFSVGEKMREHLGKQLEAANADEAKVSEFRAILHRELGIRDRLDSADALAALKKVPVFDICFFALRFCDELKVGNWTWSKEDLVRVYLLTLAANKYPGSSLFVCVIGLRFLTLAANEHPGPSFRWSNGPFDVLEIFRLGTFSRSDVEWAWRLLQVFFYGTGDDEGCPGRTLCTVGEFHDRGWQLQEGCPLPFALCWERKANVCDHVVSDLSFEESPIEYSLATGLRARNLVEYLEGCEFSGAEHLKHPFLVHLFAQQAVVDFIRKGVFYAELRASPDGYVDEAYGFEFPHVCRCLVEAFHEAQAIAATAFGYSDSAVRKSIDLPNGPSSGGNRNQIHQTKNPYWIAGMLGTRYQFEETIARFSSEKQVITAKSSALSADKILGSYYFPCKVSLLFVGKRHKETRKMILEAAAAAVMRPSGESQIGNAREFAEKELPRCRVVGFDLAGKEAGNPPGLFVGEFSRLARLHVPLTVHAGENESAQFIEDAILQLGANRIGHGLSLVEDQGLLIRVREEAIGVELCPISNHQTSAFGEPGNRLVRQYPLRQLLSQGVLVSISTDNPIISATNAVREFFQASYAFGEPGLSLWDALRLIRFGYVTSFLSLPERRAMIELASQMIIDLFTEDRIVELLKAMASARGTALA
jgi:adenosine deaminase